MNGCLKLGKKRAWAGKSRTLPVSAAFLLAVMSALFCLWAPAVGLLADWSLVPTAFQAAASASLLCLATGQAPQGGCWAAWVRDYLPPAVCRCQDVQTIRAGVSTLPFLKGFSPEKDTLVPRNSSRGWNNKWRPTRRKTNIRGDPRKQLTEDKEQHSHVDALERTRTVWKQGRGRETGRHIRRKRQQETRWEVVT